MPCEHHAARMVESEGETPGVLAPAILIECFSWRYSGGYQKFRLQKIAFAPDGEKVLKKDLESFGADYSHEEQVKHQFLEFLKGVELFQWTVWVEAFVSLSFGGQSCAMVPWWRVRQLSKLQKKEAFSS